MGKSVLPTSTKGRDNIKIIGDAKQEIIIWVSFNFQSNKEPVLPLLTGSLNGIDKIVNELSQM